MKKLRTGKTKSILLSSVDSALLAVEVYNKPRTTFRQQNYITLMVMAWTRLLQSYFYQEIGDKYYYKKKNGRYERINGERKAWDLAKCVKEFNKLKSDKLSNGVRANLKFIIGLRHKIEHRYVSSKELEASVFGECQACLYNYENLLVDLYGGDYALNEALSFSLQFSQFRTEEQQRASKTLLSKDIKAIKQYVDKFRTSLDDNVFNSQEYSIKLIQIPKISNTNRSDLAIEFVRWDELNEEDRKNYQKVTTIIKDKVVKRDVISAGKLLPSAVLNEIKKNTKKSLTHYDHKCLYFIFDIRPVSGEDKDPVDTETEYCLYDEVHKDYLYEDKWVDFLSQLIAGMKLTRKKWKKYYRERKKLDISNYK
ncbi:MAG TPA: DUF3644 domain-containing protein [Nevskiaceae bacterium]|nr:DUF3644 domain-containing protein [Nevskiaceae bacterium]